MSSPGDGSPRRRLATSVFLVLAAVAVLALTIRQLLHNPPRRSGGAFLPRVLSGGEGSAASPDLPDESACTGVETVRCDRGDLWLFDACDEASEKLEECGARLCRDAECEGPDTPSRCQGEPDGGRCRGDVAVGCHAGSDFSIDCGALGRRCIMTGEGAACREPTPVDCEPGTPSECDGDILRRCIDGRWVESDCTVLDATCGVPEPSASPRCLGASALASQDCGGCSCQGVPQGEERCDGADNDLDGYVDEGADCGVVDVVAFVIADGRRLSYTEQEVESEIIRINETFAAGEHDYSLRFHLAELIQLDRPTWLEIDESDLNEIAWSTEIHPQREEFYVPLVFTDEITSEAVPRAGVSTLPAGSCGRQRRGHTGHPVGVVVIAKGRTPTTGAHEVGHFLGLCHTHEPDAETLEVTAGPDGERCGEVCEQTGDGICDTPLDPGPAGCALDRECNLSCDGQSPDAGNAMSYYGLCRRGFTEEQALLMRRGLWLRRGWHPCVLAGTCPCSVLATDCPEKMSCRPDGPVSAETTWSCGLDGPVPPGGICDDLADCAENAICVIGQSGGRRCARPCAEGDPCDCVLQTGLGFGVCRDDLGLGDD